ncbi:MAG TPA: type III pantothenate kinase [Rhodanobacteraceae bacterium]|nr:type III pantothenate kinase [Rhodanobacteraceae bacterium]
MNLLLDLGNTRLKWAPHGDSAALAAQACAWQDDMAPALAAAWQTLALPTRVVAASVVDAAREAAVAAAVHARFGLDVQWVRTPAAACGVRNAYADADRLGIDRFLGMVAALDAGCAPCVLAGCGTALTLDALAADGRHLGGLIAPGPRLMQQAVQGATARVRIDASAGAIVDSADNTADALLSGSWHAAAALVERFAARMADRLGGAPRLLLSGGDAGALAALIERPHVVRADAVLQGLAVWARADP